MEKVFNHLGEIVEQDTVQNYKEFVLERFNPEDVEKLLLPQTYEWSNLHKACLEIVNEYKESILREEDSTRISLALIEEAIDTRWESWQGLWMNKLKEIDNGRLLQWSDLIEVSPEAKEIITKWLFSI